jgi:uncharacterized repeat protein (TIGR02543 family)
MGRRVGSAAALLLLLLLALGVANASGRTLAVTTVTVEVIGKGAVTSGAGGINCGNGAVTCYIAFSGSGTVTLTATPATGWTFDNWSGCPTAAVGNTCTVPVSGNSYEVTANFSGPPATTSTLSVTYAGDGNVSGGQIDCGSAPAGTNCTWTVLTGSTLTVLQQPDDGNVFSGWGGACSGTGVPCTVVMDGDRAVNASWASATETRLLTVSVSGGGSVRGGDISCPPTCTATEPLRSAVTLTATPDAGFAFTGWSGACTGTVPACTVTIDDDKTVGATFAATPQLSVAVSGNGNVSGGSGAINCGSNGTVCSATFTLNSTVTLTATAATGGTFIGWSGACGGSATTCTVLMSASKSVTATFSGGGVPLTVSVNGPGTVTGAGISCGNGATTCTANEPLNGSISLTATPASGATFAGWGGACSGTATTCSVSMTSAKSVSATFSGGTPSTFPLSASVTGSGVVSGGGLTCGNGATTCNANVTANSSVALTATPAGAATFRGWGGACTGTARTCTVTMNSAKSVTATFSSVSSAALTSLGRPQVKRSGSRFLVTLRFRTAQAGTARVRGLRAGRAVTTLSRRVAAGAATIGPFQVSLPGLYTFELQLGGRTLRWRTCLGRCGEAAPGPDFALTREAPTTTRSGDIWSVTLHLRANLISEARVRVFRGATVLADKHFIARAGKVVFGPFLLAPGRYTLRLTATDAYGRVRTRIWIVSLAR